MKKKTAMLLACTMLLALCTGCGTRTNGSTEENKTDSSTAENQTGSVEPICAAPNEEPLTICVDESNKDSVQSLVDAWEMLNDGVSAELVVIPTDFSEAEVKITELRTEIMAGGGPDVYILNCLNPAWLESHDVLFSNPQKMMYSDLFLPLDAYLERTQYMDTKNWNQMVLNAGKTDAGQLLLPLTYNYYVDAYRSADITSTEKIPTSWEEFTEYTDESVMSGTASTMFIRFYQIFGTLVDYENEMPLITEDELLSHVQEALAYCNAGWQVTGAVFEPAASGTMSSVLGDLKKDKNNAHTIFPLPNVDGGITASVTAYAAINRNTEQPENAFSLLDLLYSDEIMTGTGFMDEENERWIGNSVYLFTFDIPVDDTAFEKSFSSLSDEDKEAVKNINEQINVVRFYSDLDGELLDMFSACGNADSDKAYQEEIVSNTYNTIWMNLSE